jgi:bifunctional DNA-binding transcriptional regulator/antitoxin component of YhaV-PrlF toxin-antitoxin module
MIKKTIEPTGDVCVKFTEDELVKLNIKQGDKFSIKETDDGILLEKFASIELDLSEFNRDILEFLIQESCDKDISVNEVFSNIFDRIIENENLS